MSDETIPSVPTEQTCAEPYVLASAGSVTICKSFDPHQQLQAKTPLPGVIILVHGVNSMGEWFEQTEAGLCQGLMERMGRGPGRANDLDLAPMSYPPEVQPDGKLNQELASDTYVQDDGANTSPVIRFRWGYKAMARDGTNEDDNAEYWQQRIYLDEFDAWGGGPFQNGTATLADMWGLGLNDRAFWWIYTNMLPVEGRDIYASPPRAYFVHAAHRLKELIKAIRARQRNCPITVVCHSQGNMVTLGAAFLGHEEDAIADTYILCNPPYSVEDPNLLDKVTSRDQRNAGKDRGAVTKEARVATLAAFVRYVKTRAGAGQPRENINHWASLKDETGQKALWELGDFWTEPPESASQDRDNRGKIFLYCNPHDQVISALPVQGIGWKGVDAATLARIDPAATNAGAPSKD